MQQVAVSVQRHRVPTQGHLRRQLRPPINLLSDHEESGFRAGALKGFQDSWRAFRMRTIVEGERHTGLGYRPGDAQRRSSAR